MRRRNRVDRPNRLIRQSSDRQQSSRQRCRLFCALPVLGLGLGWDWGHIRCCGNGGLGFRPDGGSLGKAPSNQGLLPLTFGASLRSCSVGPPPSAIHGRGRLPRHPCRGAHCAEPALGLTRGRAPPKPKRGGLPAGLFAQRLRVVITDHSHAPRGNASRDAPRHPCARLKPGVDSGTQSVPGGIPTQSMGTINNRLILQSGDPQQSSLKKCRLFCACCFVLNWVQPYFRTRHSETALDAVFEMVVEQFGIATVGAV